MITIHILSLFPESLAPYLESSIMKRAQEKGLFHYRVHNLTNWTVRNTRRVDNRPYGWWAGTLITIEPLAKAIREIIREYWAMKILYFSPRWILHTQEQAEMHARSPDMQYLILCWHYEGIDARIFELFEIMEISIGEYVLTSGELASLIWIDSIVRLIPWVISEESLREESFSRELWGKREYPQFSRPEVFEWLRVPEVLLSGDKRKIEQWNHKHTL